MMLRERNLAYATTTTHTDRQQKRRGGTKLRKRGARAYFSQEYLLPPLLSTKLGPILERSHTGNRDFVFSLCSILWVFRFFTSYPSTMVEKKSVLRFVLPGNRFPSALERHRRRREAPELTLSRTSSAPSCGRSGRMPHSSTF